MTSSVATQAVIRVKDLQKSFGKVTAVDGVSFEVEKGWVFGLLGPNGAGKTTTVEILEGLTRPDAGTVEVLGLDPVRNADTLKERIGVQLQTAALYPNLTVIEVVELFRSFYRTSLPADQVIDSLDLGEKRNAQTRHLSGGQRQRLSVALALVNDPELIFLDEPTTGLDPAARRALWDLIRGLRERGRTIVMTTHYLDEAETLSDRVAIMDHGKILEMGTVEELVSRRFRERSIRFDAIDALGDTALGRLTAVTRVVHEEGTVSLYTSDVPATIAGLLALTEAQGIEPQNLMVRRATLEDVFLDLTGRALRD